MRNSIVANKNRVMRAWSDVIAYQRQKFLLIPQIEEVVNKYEKYESDLLAQITALRTRIEGISDKNIDHDQLKAVDVATSGVLDSLKVAVENYPLLQAKHLCVKLIENLTELQENITAAITIYNSTVQSFNNGIQMFPNTIVNSLFNGEKVLATFTDEKATEEIAYSPSFSK